MNMTSRGLLFGDSTVWRIVVSTLLALACGGCGGGTAGTGLDQDSSFEGRVSSLGGTPIADVRVTIVGTQASSVTDSEGRFEIESPTTVADSEIQIALDGDGINTTVRVPQLDATETRSALDISIDVVRNRATVSKVDVKAEIVGVCDFYFENRTVIRQANRAPQGITCTLKVRVLADGALLGDVPVALQYKSCQPSDDWDTLVEGTTSPGVHSGVAQLTFRFFDSPAFCQYRVVAPFNTPVRPVIFRIETFTFQAL